MAPQGSSKEKYKVKLMSGRIIGPVDLQRVRLLILEDQISGQELARAYPQGQWVNINQIAAIAEILVAKAGGRLDHDNPDATGGIDLKNTDSSIQIERFGGTTRMIPVESAASIKKDPSKNEGTSSKSGTSSVQSAESGNEGTEIIDRGSQVSGPGPTTATGRFEKERASFRGEFLKAKGLSLDGDQETKPSFDPIDADKTVIGSRYPDANRTREIASGGVSEQQTIMLENPLNYQNWTARDAIRDPKRLPRYLKNKLGGMHTQIRNAAVTGAILYIIWQVLSPNDMRPPNGDLLWVPYRPSLPAYSPEKPDAARSTKAYNEAIRYYLQDTVPGYKAAADRFSKAIRLDNQNVKAEAMLASSYLNLIDSSNKDENYFTVISKLIDLSRAKDIDLPETVIADVEFYVVTNKPEAAQSRIVEYTRTRPNFAQEMYYYLSLAFYHRGDATSANRLINEYRARPFSAKLFYLRGQIDEKLGDSEAAVREYEQAIALNPRHAKSRLAIVRILAAKNMIQDATVHIEFLTAGHFPVPKGAEPLEKTNDDGTLDNRLLLAPIDLAQAYYFAAQLSQLHNRVDLALAQMERALKLDPDNSDFLLDYYGLRAKHGEKLSTIQPEARMYYFLTEGEKYVRQGDSHAALSQFLQAREQMPKATLPFVKIGDMFARIHDLTNARANYKVAAERAPKSIEIWTKYINMLIQSYEWDDAKSAMDRFRQLPVPQSAIDKAAADMLAKQGRFTDAQAFYRKAMRRDTIDSSVYIAYAKSLIATKNYKDAPFFFALALRFDPLNSDAISGTAKCIAATESIDRAISYLQDELQKGSAPSSDLLSSIAELQIQKGAWPAAEQFVNQAIQANPDNARPYSLQAQVYLNRENTDKNALDKALDSYNSYSDRNQSDPSGYLERFRIFIKKGNYERASEELGKIFAIYSKYPNLHFYKGTLYALMGNHRAAIDEFNTELKYNPYSVSALISMGKEYIFMGGATEGLQLFQKAMQLDPVSSEAKAEAANANFLLKNYQGSVALYMSAIALDKGNPLYYKRLGLVYREMGDGASASVAFGKYLEMEPDAADKDEVMRYR